ncbi:MAG: glycosyltransferase family 87 protein [Jaaginema sp. PMC 1079.18]|nr:glycosyltransferase family 87 protein [Jaaginema sp. PMC 1080.18]MEC4850575.1 glycosyltransferase family 87 protein [Jaaginema sp. PMC 1079.18]MEC4866688.1 glycosyltransferase family 87 protein [Jaaginema sp. PMC 1078.18]
MLSWIKLVFRHSACRWAVFIASIIFIVGFGVIGVGRDGPFGRQYDMRFLYVAGRAWLQGLNAYDPVAVNRVSYGLPETVRIYDFAYPPQIAPFVMSLGAFSWRRARHVLIVSHFISAIAMSGWCVGLLRQEISYKWERLHQGMWWYIPALVIGNPFTAEAMWMGQTSTIMGAAVVGGWYYYQRQQWLPSGILWAIASIKPHLCILPLLWLVLERQWRILGTMLGGILVLAFIPITISGIPGIFTDWWSAVSVYKEQPFNELGWYGKMYLQNAIYAISNYWTHGNGLMLPNLMPLAVVLMVGLWWFRDRFLLNDILGIALALTFSLGFGNYYDLVVLVVLIPLFWRHVCDSLVQASIALGLFLGMGLAVFLPRLLAFSEPILVLLQLRVFFILGSASWLTYLSYKQTKYKKKRVANTH